MDLSTALNYITRYSKLVGIDVSVNDVKDFLSKNSYYSDKYLEVELGEYDTCSVVFSVSAPGYNNSSSDYRFENNQEEWNEEWGNLNVLGLYSNVGSTYTLPSYFCKDSIVKETRDIARLNSLLDGLTVDKIEYDIPEDDVSELLHWVYFRSLEDSVLFVQRMAIRLGWSNINVNGNKCSLYQSRSSFLNSIKGYIRDGKNTFGGYSIYKEGDLYKVGSYQVELGGYYYIGIEQE